MRPTGGAAIACSLLLATLVMPLQAQEITWTGQVRPRYEYRDPTGVGVDEFTSMRVRLGMQARLDANVSVFMQFQDVRLWGEEVHPLTDFRADNFDLHQAYIRYTGKAMPWMTTTLGRMETNLGGQRLVGAIDWTQQGQSFDGVRIDVARGWGTLALLGYKIGDETAASATDDKELFGAYATLKDLGPGSLDAYWLNDRVSGSLDTDRTSMGARYAFSGDVSGRFEATLQRGNALGADVAAFMFGARVGTSFADKKASLTLWYDYLSGDDPATPESEVFNSLYATNHKFYGFADLFLNIPSHTAGHGLQDAALKATWSPSQTVMLGADMHSFRASEQGSLSTAHFADELDLTAVHRYTERLAMTVGLAYVIQDDALAEVGRLTENMTWVYVMLSASF